MYALEAEPEKSGRWRRLGVGALLAVLIGGGVIFAAHTVAPNSKLFKSVMKIAIVDYEPPKPKPRDAETPPPPKPPPPKPKPKETAPAQKAEAPPPNQQAQNPGEPDIGLDSTSFGSGSGGAAFHAGTSQMGDPTGRGGGGPQPVEADKPAPKLLEARPRPGNKQPGYSDRARRMAIEGLVVVEADIDERGRVTRAVVRNKLEPELDEETRKVVLAWAFDPATLQGKAVASTKFLRFRFQLQ
jgi:periplasmic protein TonB